MTVLLERGRRMIIFHPTRWMAILRRSEEHTSELQSQSNLVCRLLLEKKTKQRNTRVVIQGSHKTSLEGAKLTGKLDPNERLEVTVRVRPRAALAASTEFAALTGSPPAQRRPLSREEFAARFGADPADVERIEQFAHEHDLDVVSSHAGQRTVRLSGTLKAMQAAFGVKLKAAVFNKVKFRHRSGAISVPKDVAPLIEGVFGLDNRPVVRAHFRFKPLPKGKRPRAGSARPFTPVEVASVYNFPTGVDGSGQCIAILEFGGGYRRADLKKYFTGLGVPMPTVTTVSVDGGHNSPTGDPQSADGEVMLDIEVAGAIAPKAKLAVYFAPNSDDSFLNALRVARG